MDHSRQTKYVFIEDDLTIKSFLLHVGLPLAFAASVLFSAVWFGFEDVKDKRARDAETLKKLGFEVIVEGNECHAKIKDGSWRTCQRVLLVMGG